MLCVVVGYFQLCEAVVEDYLVDDGLNDYVDLRLLGVVGGTYVVYAVIANKVVEDVALSLDLWVKDRYGVSAEVLHELHTGNVGRSVAKIYHSAEGYGALALLHEAVDILGVEYRLHALVYLEDELRLVGIVHCHCGPVGYAVDIIEERACVYVLELVGYGRALDYLLQARGVDVVEYAHATLRTIAIDTSEPLLHATKEGDVATRFAEGLAPERQPLRLCRLEHACHICEHLVGILLLGKGVGLVPELYVALAHGGDEVVLLHISRCQRAVEVVDKGYGNHIFHNLCLKVDNFTFIVQIYEKNHYICIRQE